MSETAHTPGPWVWERDKIEEDGLPRVAVFSLKGPDVLCRYWRDNPPTADARLIASAPDLLAALKAAVAPHCVGHAGSVQRFFRDNTKSRAALELIFAAIAKAEGRS